MSSNPGDMDHVKSQHLKHAALALACIWVILFIAAVGATIYREFDGPTVRSTIADNVNLASINHRLNLDLDSAQNINDQLHTDLLLAQSDHAGLQYRLDSLLTSLPLIQISP